MPPRRRGGAPARAVPPPLPPPDIDQLRVASPALLVMADAVAQLHSMVTLRQVSAIRAVGAPSVRSREVLWCVVEALRAAFQGEALTHKDLAAMAQGVISSATLTRAIERAEARGMLRRRPVSGDRRSWLIEPTPASAALLLAHAEPAFQELRVALDEAERRLAQLREPATEPPAPQAAPRPTVVPPPPRPTKPTQIR